MTVDVKKIVTDKYAGVPFAAWAGGVVALVFAVQWWRKRNGAATATSPAGATDTTTPGGNDTTSQPLFLAQPVPVQSTTGAVLASTGQAATNDAWRSMAVQWLMSSRGLSSVDATRVIDDYLNGQAQSIADGTYRDAAIAQFGLPPSIPSGGSTIQAPKAAKQGTPPCLHYVTGNGDSTWLELSYLYFGTAGYKDQLAAANPNVSEPITANTPVNIPALNVTSPAGTLSAPTNLQTSAVTTNNFTLSWNPVAGATGYEIHYPNGVDKTLTDTHAFIYGLAAHTTYTFTVYAMNGTTRGPGASINVHTK